MSIHNSTNLKKGSGISLLPATWAQIDTWVNIASSAKANGPRITRGDVVGEMATFLVRSNWNPGDVPLKGCDSRLFPTPPAQVRNGVVAARPAKSRK